jgi:hypothetical protein
MAEIGSGGWSGKCLSGFKQVFIGQYVFYPIRMLNCKPDIDPLIFQSGKKYCVPFGAAVILWIPGLKATGSMQSPLSVPDGQRLDNDSFNISQTNCFPLHSGKVIIFKNDFIIAYGNEAV